MIGDIIPTKSSLASKKSDRDWTVLLGGSAVVLVAALADRTGLAAEAVDAASCPRVSVEFA